jgi:hypothetical protein
LLSVEYQEEPRSHRQLTYDHSGAMRTWVKSEFPAGQVLRQQAPLSKLDESVVEEEYVRLPLMAKLLVAAMRVVGLLLPDGVSSLMRCLR